MNDSKASPDTPVLLGFLCQCTLMLTIVSIAVSLLVGTIWYPHYVGLGMVLPWYTHTLLLDRKEMKDGSPWRSFSQNFYWFPILRRFLQLKLVLSDELQAAENKADENKPPQFLFAVFPHGSNSDYRILMDGMLYDTLPKIGPNIRTLAASVLFRIPLVREFALWTGCIDASRSVAERALKRGRSVLVLPGGQAEQIRTVHGKETIYLHRRKGFVKLALKHNVPLVPVYVFGVSDYYHTWFTFFELRLWLLKNLGICIPLAFGLYGSPLSPFPVKTTIVFGNPLSFTIKEPGAPSTDELNKAHHEFSEAIKQLFDQHKMSLGYGERELETI
jgi:2-acylglycerol O-acyltransferase 2